MPGEENGRLCLRHNRPLKTGKKKIMKQLKRCLNSGSVAFFYLPGRSL
jgi:hypothetical protein